MWRNTVVVTTLLMSAFGTGVLADSTTDSGGLLTCTNPGRTDSLPTGGGLAAATIRPGEAHYWLVPVEPGSTVSFFDGIIEGGTVDVAMADQDRPWRGAEACEPTCHFGFFEVPLQPVQKVSGGCGGNHNVPLLVVTLKTLSPGIDAASYQFHVGSCSLDVYGTDTIGDHCAFP